MAFCAQCGSRIPDSAKTCPTCGAAVGSGDDGRKVDTQGGGQTSVSPVQDIVLADKEQVVRSYQCSKLRHPRCLGTLTVTNKRIIFQGRASSSRVTNEVVLDSVAGINSYYGLNVSGFGLFLALVLLILGIAFAEDTAGSTIAWAVFLDIVILAFSIRRTFRLVIYSSKATGTPISIGEGARSVIGNGALFTLTAKPSADTDRMLSELGALIQDLQTLGDHAIGKWRQ